MITTTRTEDLVLLLAACEAAQVGRVPWWQVARAVERVGAVEPLLAGPWDPADRWEYEVAEALANHLRADARERWGQHVEAWLTDGDLSFVTILDDIYPTGLRLVFNPPPFLFLRGRIEPRDVRGVAVVGTRRPTGAGVRRARRLAGQLAAEGITIYSGLAAGIDAAAHEAALETGGRTVAVLGQGLSNPLYPASNRSLAGAIPAHGALVSQFRPDTPPTRATFPMRNVVTSGLSQATAVVEAGETSGARMQARIAAEQGKRVWLLASLVESAAWARDFVDRYAASVRVVQHVDDVLEELVVEDEVVRRAAGGLPAVHAAEAKRRPAPTAPRLFGLD